MSTEIKLNIPKMSCNNCVKTITNGLNDIGLNDLKFDLGNKNVEIHGDNLNEREILKVLRRMDYPAEII